MLAPGRPLTAVTTELRNENGTVAFEVEVLKHGQRHTVLVDPLSGEVLKTTMSDNEDNESGSQGDDD